MERCGEPGCQSCRPTVTAIQASGTLPRLRDANNPYAKEFQGNRAARRAYQREFGGRRK